MPLSTSHVVQDVHQQKGEDGHEDQQSGNSTRHGHITRAVSSWLRWALVEAAIHASTRPGPTRDRYLALKKKKGNKIARVAVARRLATYVYHMLKETKTYQEVVSYSIGDLG